MAIKLGTKVRIREVNYVVARDKDGKIYPTAGDRFVKEYKTTEDYTLSEAEVTKILGHLEDIEVLDGS